MVSRWRICHLYVRLNAPNNRDENLISNFVVSSCIFFDQHGDVRNDGRIAFILVYFKERWFPTERLFENMVWICSAFAIAVDVSTLLLISTVLMIGGSQNS